MYFGTVLYKLALVRIEVYIVSTKTTGSEKDLWVGILYCLLGIAYLAFGVVYLSSQIWDCVFPEMYTAAVSVKDLWLANKFQSQLSRLDCIP